MKIPKDFPWPHVWDAGDARVALPAELAGNVDLVATSTPYWSKARYSDDDNEFGSGPLCSFIDDQVRLAERVWDAVRPGGWYALNLGDTRANTGGAGGQVTKAGQRIYRPEPVRDLEGQQWLGVPQMAFRAVQTRTRWRWQGHVLWDKGRPVLADNSGYHLRRNRRPGLQHEEIALFWKPDGPQTWNADVLEQAGEIGSVWRISPATDRPPRAQRSDDVKAWPTALAGRLIELLTLPGDLVVDPCAGYGTTARAAAWLGRRGIALDLYWHTAPWDPAKAPISEDAA